MKKLFNYFMLTLSCVLLLSFVGCNVSNSDSNNSETLTVKLTSSSTIVNVEDKSVTKQLTATVYPEDAINDKSIDWFVDWDINNEGENAVVSDYITVTPLEDGSNVANVTIYKDFENSSFIVYALTRVGGFSANCIVRYVGEPSALSIFNDENEPVYDDGCNTNIVNLYVGDTYYFDLEFDNIFNNVTNNYVPNIEISGNSFGQVMVNRKYYTNTTDNPEWIFNREESSTEDLVYQNNSWGLAEGTTLSYNHSSLLDVSFVDGKIKIVANKTITSYSGVASQRGSKCEYETNYCDVNVKPYLELTITDTNSGVSQNICIRTLSVVSDVSLNNSELVF